MRLECKWALTATGWQEDVTIVTDDSGIIVAIQPSVGTDERANGFVIPGLPNLHSHAFQRALAGRTEYVEPGREDSFWTWRTAMYALALRLEPDDLEVIAAQLYVEMLEAGMTSVGEFHYLHHAPDGARYASPEEMSLRILRAAERTQIALTHLPVLYLAGGFNRPPEDSQRRFVHSSLDAFLDTVVSLEPTIAAMPNARLGIAPHSLRAVGGEAIREAAGRTGPIHIHIAEQTAEVEACIETLGVRPVRWLLDNVPVDGRFCLVHATHVDEDEVHDVAKSRAVVGLCPTTEANLGDGIFPARNYLERGGAFGVGSDSHVTISGAEELRLLEYGQRLVARRRNLLVDENRHVGTALYQRAVAGGARALDQPAASIAVGERADLVHLDAEHPRLVGHDADTILDAWIFGSADAVVQDVWVAGDRVVSDGRHRARDEIRASFATTMNRLYG